MGAWPAVCNPQHPLLRPDKSKGAAAVFQFSAPGAPRLPPPSHTAAQFSAIRAEPGTLRRARPSGPEPARSPGCCVALAARNQAVQTGSPLRYARRPPSARAAPSRHRAADAASSKPSPRRPSRRKRPRRPLKTAALPPHPRRLNSACARRPGRLAQTAAQVLTKLNLIRAHDGERGQGGRGAYRKGEDRT